MERDEVEARFEAALARAATSGARAAEPRLARILKGRVPTFMEAPPLADVRGADLAVFGFPYEGIRARDPRTLQPAAAGLDEPTYARGGADRAPDAIREQSIYYSLDHSGGMFLERARGGFSLTDYVTIADGGDLPVDPGLPAEDCLLEASDRLLKLIGARTIPITLGGDDTAPFVAVRAVQRQRRARVAVLKLDSHMDLAWEPRFWAGSQWARLFEFGHLEPENLALVGIRGLRNPVAWYEAAQELGVRFWTMQDVEERGIKACVLEALDAVAADVDLLYVSFDLGVVDPAFLPAQRFPDPGGLTASEALQAIRTALDHGPDAVGFDMASLGPAYDLNGLGAQLAARLAVEFMGGIAARRAGLTAPRATA